MRYNTDLDYHIIDGEVPEILMNGQADDIIHICEYNWLYWEMFCDGPHVSYPENNLVLGQYLGPALDIGPSMCAKVLKKNGRVVLRSTLRNLTREEIDRLVHKEHRRPFFESVIACLGTAAMTGDFPG